MPAGMSTFRLLLLTLAESRALLADLFRLAKAEIGAQFSKLSRGLILGLGAVMLILLAIPFLLVGLIELLIVYGFARYAAFFIGGGILVFMALILTILTAVALKGLNFVPSRTIEQVKRIKSDALGQNKPEAGA